MIRAATIAALALMIAGCDGGTPVTEQATTPAPIKTPFVNKQPSAVVDAAVKAIKAEKSVIDLVHADGETFQWVVGMKSDGTPRYGFAEYLCAVLAGSGVDVSGQAVRIVDYNRYVADGDGRAASMGAVDCQTGRHVFP